MPMVTRVKTSKQMIRAVGIGNCRRKVYDPSKCPTYPTARTHALI
jgi:hypothetical protein